MPTGPARIAFIALGLAAIAIFATPAASQIAPISLQGRLTGVASGEHDFTLTIWDAQVGGTAIHSAQTTAVVEGGLFTLLADVPASAFDGAERWWSVSVDGGADTSRQRVASVPMALSAASLGGGFTAVEPDTGAGRFLRVGETGMTGWLRVNQSSNDLFAAVIENRGGSGPGLLVRAATGTTFAETPLLRVETFNDEMRLVVEEGGYTRATALELDARGLARSLEDAPRLVVRHRSNESFATEIRNAGGDGPGLLVESSSGSTGSNVPLLLVRSNAGGEFLRVTEGGRTRVAVLEITGGSDLAEPFPASPTTIDPRPGMVLSIDPENPGALRVCDQGYDSKVAGVYSGGGGLPTGLLMGKDGDDLAMHGVDRLPLAMTGRVWVYADVSNGEIHPGDRLTTSAANPGFAARVDDESRAPGTVIGKAMTGIDERTGMVLVLVNLQ